MKNKIRVATIFSGIGAFEQALKKMNIEHEIILAVDNGELSLPLSEEQIQFLTKDKTNKEKRMEINTMYEELKKKNFVKESYLANYSVENFEYDVKYIKGSDYKDISILVGGSPCQAFSISGKRLGFEDTRGTLFYEYARILKEMNPKTFIYENVPGLLSHDSGRTWDVVRATFDELGYVWKYSVLNAKHFGIPQNRRRVFVVGIRKDLANEEFNWPEEITLEKETKDFLESSIENKYYHGEKGFKWTTKPMSLKKRVSINSTISRTQAANQQFNWCGDMRFETKIPKRIQEDARIWKGNFKDKYGVVRKLTPRECLRLMGFSDEFKIEVPDKEMYHQSGNSIVVNVLEEIMKEIIKTGVYDE
ncbi:DNA cytosine methyltransferase [Mycoplasma marinum]|uniref:Cytosine-specific methyltransferase n=1 Tax=Mycoplasma marinum TaxID=1937190 RepID=A0A4V2NI48_9MOLU|nr:DNA (cytosine-5-)-methyltransferase [Mycoplasma marinum]TCG10968.1 DNA (cytosine-5-)-methyltransferase [Mycoplasma marinum]